MLYADDASIKGDFKVVAHGSSALVARDQRNVFLTQVAPQLLANPSFGIDPTRLFKEVAKISGLSSPEDIMFSPEELAALQTAQAQAGSQDPRVLSASVQAQARVKVAEMNNETGQLRVNRDTDRDTKYVEAETMRTQVAAETKMAELQLRRELAMMEYANKNAITLQQLKATLAIEAGRNDLSRELATMPTVEDVIDGVKPAAEQQLNPNGEPPGRAPQGMGAAL